MISIKEVALYAAVLYLTLRFLVFLRDFLRGYSTHEQLKGPVRLPLVDNLFEFIHYNRLLDYMHEQFLKHGPNMYFKVPTMPAWYFTSDPAVLEHVHKQAYAKYKKEGDLAEILADLLGSGIFAIDNDQWRTQRKIAANIFTVKNFRDFFMTVFSHEITHVLDLIDTTASNETVLDLHELFHRYTLESFAFIGFGVNLKLFQQDKADPTSLAFAKSFDQAQGIVNMRFFNPFWRVTERLDGSRGRFEGYLDTMRSFTKSVLRTCTLDGGGTDGDDLLSRFVNAGKFSEDELHDIVINFIIAGRDTTAQALSWAFWNLTKHPEVVKKMREEINEVAERMGVERVGGRLVLKYEDVMQLKYVKAVFSETLRLYPSVPKQAKVAVEDDVWPDGTFVPKGSWACWSSYVNGRLESIWGKDSLEFKPERFINDPNPTPFKFPAFNMGPRLCLGMNMAYLEGALALASIVDLYDFECVNPESVTYGHALTLPMRTTLEVKVTKVQ